MCSCKRRKPLQIQGFERYSWINFDFLHSRFNHYIISAPACLEVCMKDNDVLFELFQHKSRLILWRSLWSTKQQRCAATIEDGFKGDWGCFPQQAIFADTVNGRICENEETCTGFHCLPLCDRCFFGIWSVHCFAIHRQRASGKPEAFCFLCFEIGPKWENARILNERLWDVIFTTWQAV